MFPFIRYFNWKMICYKPSIEKEFEELTDLEIRMNIAIPIFSQSIFILKWQIGRIK